VTKWNNLATRSCLAWQTAVIGHRASERGKFAALVRIGFFLLAGVVLTASLHAEGRPNILWITAEDMSANLGCYGDHFATTPNLDDFAQQAVRYTQAYATAPVCSPARSCLITGVYATSLGTQRLRSAFPIPKDINGFPSYLRRKGYFTSNNFKTDYNVQDEAELIRDSWDQNGPAAHWRQRATGQPFFSVFNLMTTHQSRTGIWPAERFEAEIGQELSAAQRHDPQAVVVPLFYPDTLLARQTLARYYDCITMMDQQVGQLLAELEEDGLADKTIVFFYSDHGMGIPRGKRLLHDTGMHVPLLVRFPEKYLDLAPSAAGSICTQLVSFVDFPPTVLSLTATAIPAYMQGTAFLGEQAGAARKFVYGARDRVDEAFDVSRSVRDERFLYIRNYMPHHSWMPPEWYSDQSPMRGELRHLLRTGKLNSAQLTYAGERKPVEELYDTQADPPQLTNLASSSQHQERIQQMRQQLRHWLLETRDLGFLTEADAWQRSRGGAPRTMGMDTVRYPLSRILAAAEMVGSEDRRADQARLLFDADPAVRYWAAVGLSAAGSAADRGRLEQALHDSSWPVRIEVAAALARLGASEPAMATLIEATESDRVENILHAVRALELLDDRARPALPALKRVFARARRELPKRQHPCWLFVVFSADAALWQLEPDSQRQQLRF
jgi:N-sulfoglucosamine sulfohydrolase